MIYLNYLNLDLGEALRMLHLSKQFNYKHTKNQKSRCHGARCRNYGGGKTQEKNLITILNKS